MIVSVEGCLGFRLKGTVDLEQGAEISAPEKASEPAFAAASLHPQAVCGARFQGSRPSHAPGWSFSMGHQNFLLSRIVFPDPSLRSVLCPSSIHSFTQNRHPLVSTGMVSKMLKGTKVCGCLSCSETTQWDTARSRCPVRFNLSPGHFQPNAAALSVGFLYFMNSTEKLYPKTLFFFFPIWQWVEAAVNTSPAPATLGCL